MHLLSIPSVARFGDQIGFDGLDIHVEISTVESPGSWFP